MFQFGVFCPTFRTHGTRRNNEVWSHGEEVEKLVKPCKVCHRLMPHLFPCILGWSRPVHRLCVALWMDFSTQCVIGDESARPALPVVPVTEHQGAVSREVYFPKEQMVWFLTDENWTAVRRSDAPERDLFCKEGSPCFLWGSVSKQQRRADG